MGDEHQAPNTIDYVTASEVRPGDQLLVLKSILTVTAVTPYNLAVAKGQGIEDKIVETSGPSHRWRVLHILTDLVGIVRFEHELVARLARI